jgi:hypothetical protein
MTSNRLNVAQEKRVKKIALSRDVLKVETGPQMGFLGLHVNRNAFV